MGELTEIAKYATLVIPVLFAITVHEVAHGWMAKRLGDSTAQELGRLTLNPLKHIDAIGTILVPIATFAVGGFLFGWAKPVPVNWRKLGHPRRDMAIVAVAGPTANLLMALFWSLIIKAGLSLAPVSAGIALSLVYMGSGGVFINVILLVLNLFPLLPLDGGRVAAALLPPRIAAGYSRLEPFGLVIVVLLLVSGYLGVLIWPPIQAILGLIETGFGIRLYLPM